MLPHGRTDGAACAHGHRDDARPHAGARPTVPPRLRARGSVATRAPRVSDASLAGTPRGATELLLGPRARPPLRHPTSRPPRSTRRRTILGVHFLVAVSLCSGAVTRYQVSYSSFAPPQEPGLQPYFARGTYQCRNSTSGCLLAPLRGLCHHFESAALPDSPPLTFAAPYAVFSNVRPSASIPFDPAALSEAVAVDGRAAACVCGLRGGGGRDSIVAGARGVGPGTYDAPGLSRRRHGDGSKAVMSLCCGSISSLRFAPPQESGLQSYELRRRRASLILAEQLRGGLDALQRRRRLPQGRHPAGGVAARAAATRPSAPPPMRRSRRSARAAGYQIGRLGWRVASKPSKGHADARAVHDARAARGPCTVVRF